MHWIKNGPEVKKPCDHCLVRTKDGFTDIAQWSHDPDCLIWSNTQNVYGDDEVAHFAVIASPLSRSRRMEECLVHRKAVAFDALEELVRQKLEVCIGIEDDVDSTDLFIDVPFDCEAYEGPSLLEIVESLLKGAEHGT